METRKVFLLTYSSICIDDGIAGIFSTREKATAYFEAHPREFISTAGKTADAFIEEWDVDPK